MISLSLTASKVACPLHMSCESMFFCIIRLYFWCSGGSGCLAVLVLNQPLKTLKTCKPFVSVKFVILEYKSPLLLRTQSLPHRLLPRQIHLMLSLLTHRSIQRREGAICGALGPGRCKLVKAITGKVLQCTYGGQSNAHRP